MATGIVPPTMKRRLTNAERDRAGNEKAKFVCRTCNVSVVASTATVQLTVAAATRCFLLSTSMTAHQSSRNPRRNMLKISDVRAPSEPKTYAVIDVSRSIGKGDPGALVSIHKGQTEATRAAKKIKHS